VRAGKIHEQELSTGGGKINLKNRSLERKSPDDNQRAPDPKRTTKPTTRKKNPCGRKICRRRGVLHSRANRAGNRLSGRANRAGAVWITARVLLARIDERSARFTGRTVWAQNEISGGIRIEHEANESRPGRDRLLPLKNHPGAETWRQRRYRPEAPDNIRRQKFRSWTVTKAGKELKSKNLPDLQTTQMQKRGKQGRYKN
jgi:hypothetical protein